MWSSLPTSAAAAPRVAHAPRSTMCSFAGDVRSRSSAALSPPAAGGKGPQAPGAGELNLASPHTAGDGGPADVEFLVDALVSFPNLRMFQCPGSP